MAKELGESYGPIRFSTISLGPLSIAPAQSISIKEFVSDPPCLSDASYHVAREFSVDSLDRAVIVHTLVSTASKRKLDNGQSHDEEWLVKQFGGEF